VSRGPPDLGLVLEDLDWCLPRGIRSQHAEIYAFLVHPLLQLREVPAEGFLRVLICQRIPAAILVKANDVEHQPLVALPDLQTMPGAVGKLY
jgi:hypothetical protein